MDERVLATKGIKPAEVKLGFVDGFRLHIGERATLVRHPGSRAYGAMMEITPGEVSELYADESVSDYLPEPVIVEFADGTQDDATCYNLTGAELVGTNREYAESLLNVATRLGFPGFYLDQIRQAVSRDI